MQEVENLIEIYHTASFISLILGILLLALSVLLFFKFDILKIFDCLLYTSDAADE